MPSNKDFYDALKNISLSADNVNLNVDQVETKLDTANGILTTLSTDIALIKPDVDDIRADLANGVAVTGTFYQATQPVSGTVTANAGTNLNTSALALETTATSIKTAVEILDNAISGNEMQVDIVSSAAIPVTDNGGTLTFIETGKQCPPASHFRKLRYPESPRRF